jgi:hypothetical protein
MTGMTYGGGTYGEWILANLLDFINFFFASYFILVKSGF